MEKCFRTGQEIYKTIMKHLVMTEIKEVLPRIPMMIRYIKETQEPTERAPKR